MTKSTYKKQNFADLEKLLVAIEQNIEQQLKHSKEVVDIAKFTEIAKETEEAVVKLRDNFQDK